MELLPVPVREGHEVHAPNFPAMESPPSPFREAHEVDASNLPAMESLPGPFRDSHEVDAPNLSPAESLTVPFREAHEVAVLQALVHPSACQNTQATFSRRTQAMLVTTPAPQIPAADRFDLFSGIRGRTLRGATKGLPRTTSEISPSFRSTASKEAHRDIAEVRCGTCDNCFLGLPQCHRAA